MKKVEKNNTEEKELDIDNIKLKKKFKSLRKWAFVGEVFLLVPALLIILALICMYGEKIIFKTNEVEVALILDENSTQEVVTAEDYIKFAEEFVGLELYFENETDDYKLFVVKLNLFIVFINYIMFILIIDNLCKLFGNIENGETPFDVKNIKYLNRVELLVFTLWILGRGPITMSLMSLIIISAIIYIYKYGCNMQKELDEVV